MTDADFREAFARHKDVVYRFAYRMSGSSPMAEDIAQDCFVEYWRKPDSYVAARGTLRAFLLGVARNLILKRWRAERPLRDEEELDDETQICQPVDLAGEERAEAVRKAVMSLPPLQREVLIFAEYEEMSLEEISRATAAELAAVKSRLHRARQNLRRMLQAALCEGEVK